MPYARKRAKPNPKASPVVQEPRSLSTSISPTAVVESTQNENSEATAQAEASDRSEDSRKLSGNPSKRWYGSWNNKVVPVTQVTSSSATVTSTTSKNRADELAETTSVSSTPSSEAPKVALRSPYSHLSPGGSTRSLPVTATTTKLHVSSSDLNISNSNRSNGSLKVGDTQVEQPAKSTSETENHIQEENHTSSIAPTPETNSNVNWLGWLPYGGTKKESPTNKSQECEIEDSTNNLSKEGQPTSPKKQRRESDPTPVTKVERTSKLEPPQAPISWLSRWTTMNSASTPAPTSEDPSSRIIKSSNVPAENNLPLETTVTPTNPAESATPSSGWAFWSRSPAIAASGSMNTGYGQLAVANSSAQDNSAGAIIESRGLSGTPNSLGKRIRPRSQEIPRGNKKEDDNVTVESSENETRIAKSSSLGEPVITVASNKKGNTAHNLLLPSFRRTFSPGPESLNFFQQLSRFLYAQPSIFKRLTLIKDPPRIRKALAIGVHGYFPLPIIQTVLGRPTGTSIKFAENAARAIHQFAQTRGYSIDKVEKIALEGEGKIEERIDILWKLLLNWIDKIRDADFILLACHSQGVPVAISLMAKLIDFGCVNNARVGICAMAGINTGPFPDYRSRWISGSAGELFDFSQPDSKVSKDYEAALNTVLKFGAKIAYIGSFDDQLVSLHSSTHSAAEHPSIYRAVWVDGRIHVADFLTHLVGFALRLRNLGISEHGLIQELSNPIAGSLVGGEGHSRLYEDLAVYSLAVEFALETSSLDNVTLRIDRPLVSAQNPYILPFAMRGLLEEDFVRKELASETGDLLKQFDNWKPTTKGLKDVKYRLEGVRSKL